MLSGFPQTATFADSEGALAAMQMPEWQLLMVERHL
jgi:hypothetical protein